MVDLTRIEHGRVGVRTSTDQVLTCRLQDIRHSLTFMSTELMAFLGAADDDPQAASGTPAHHAQQVAQACADDLKTGTVLTLGLIRTSSREWIETPQTEVHRQVYIAFVAENVFRTTCVIAVRLSSGVRTLTAREEYSSSLSVWWSSTGARQLNFLHSGESKLSTVALAGQMWPNVRVTQMLTAPDEEEWLTSQRWTVPRPPTSAPLGAPQTGDGASG